MKLAPHQSEAVRLSDSKSMALFHDCGTGKTITALAVFDNNRKHIPGLRMVVIVSPKVLINTSWKDDIEKYNNSLAAKPFTYGELRKLKGDIPDIVLTNYEWFRTDKNYVAFLKLITENDFMCVLDESTHIKSHKSIAYKRITRIAERFKYRYVMSGTPTPNSMLDIWTQMNFVRPDILGPSFYKFRKQFGEFVKIYPSGRKQYADVSQLNIPSVARPYMQRGFRWSVSQERTAEILETIKPFTHWVKEKDVLDLPEQQFLFRPFELSLNEKKAYKQFEKDMILDFKGKTVSVDTATAKMMKLRQLCGGFIYDNAGYTATGTSKLDALFELLEEIGHKQVVIWVHFRYEAEQIIERLKENGKTFACISGTVNADDKAKASNDFINGDVQYMVANPASAGHGLTWVNANYAVYYSMDFNYETWYQSTKRIHRRGQDSRTFYYTLVAEGTLEKRIVKAIQNKQGLQDFIEEIINDGKPAEKQVQEMVSDRV